jgi:hypothetical protein
MTSPQDVTYGQRVDDRIASSLTPTAAADLITVETKVLPRVPQSSAFDGFWVPWFSTLTGMYKRAGRAERLIFATILGAVGVIAAITTAGWMLPANSIGMTLVWGLAPLPIILTILWLAIISQK